jgi:hypothetical protein
LAVEESLRYLFSQDQLDIISNTNDSLRSGSFVDFTNSNVHYVENQVVLNAFYVAQSPRFERGACAALIDFDSGMPPSMIEGPAIYALMRRAAKESIVNDLEQADIRRLLLPIESVLPPQSGDVYESYKKPIVYPTKFGVAALDWKRTGNDNGIAKVGIKKDGQRNFNADEFAWCFRDGSCTN